jgi:23S rRNA (adenine2503-C2)-methyltransferase
VTLLALILFFHQIQKISLPSFSASAGDICKLDYDYDYDCDCDVIQFVMKIDHFPTLPPSELSQAGDTLPVLRGMTRQQVDELVARAGFEPFRTKQLYHWIFEKQAGSIDEMSNLPRDVRDWLARNTRLTALEKIRVQGEPGNTQKVLFKTHDNRFIESVVMREDGDRISLCISSQVGCAMGCTFCLTGYGGFQRNLEPAEIVDQVIQLKRDVMEPDEPVHHMVFMGMGEPLHNPEGVIPAVRIITDPEGFALSKRRVTVSTVGHVTGLEKLSAAGLGVGLAVSLNATTDEVRDRIMPLNRRWPIGALLDALRSYPLEPRRRITIEYVLLKGMNDSTEDAARLVGLLGNIRCKVNLIMFNPCPQLDFEPCDASALDRFAGVLSGKNMTVTVRWSKGREIDAACGQLAAHHFEPLKQA